MSHSLPRNQTGAAPPGEDHRWIQAVIGALDTGGERSAGDWPALNAPAFRVYRNTVRLGAMDALKANYRTVLTMVGDEWFAAAAHAFIDACPPASPCLLDYGAAFPEYLASLDAVAELPYLHAVAHLDRAWTEAHVAADAEPVSLDAVPRLAAADVRLQPHPAARAYWFAESPAAALWCATRDGVEDLSGVPWSGAGVLLTRPQWSVRWAACDAVAAALLEAFVGGQTIDAAVGLVATHAGPEAAGQSFYQLIAQGALSLTPAGDSV